MDKRLTSLVLKCSLSESKRRRMKYAKQLIEELDKTYDIINDLVERLACAAEKIQSQNEWEHYLYLAMGKYKYSICHKAKLMKNKEGE